MIERLYVNNFRCFENFSIDFVGRPSALIIGKNGAGKSTLRQALEVLQKISRGSNRMKQLIVQSDFTQGRIHVPIRFEIELRLTDRHFKYGISFEFPQEVYEARVAEERLEVDGEVVFSRVRGEVTPVGGPPFGLDWHLVGLPAINVRVRSADAYRNQLLSFFSSMILIAPIPSEMRGFAEEESFEIKHDASNFSSWLNALIGQYPAAYNEIFSYLQSVIPDLESFENVPRGEKGKQLRLRFDQPEGNEGFSLEFKNLSDGEKCFFLSALISASNRFRPVFCMWDEPDNHLSLSEISHFIMRLRKLSNQKGQFIATSHHPQAIRRFSDENTFVFTRKSHLEPTVVRLLSELQYTGDLIDALVLDETLA